MKKPVALLMTAALCATLLVGCGSTNTPAATETAQTESVETTAAETAATEETEQAAQETETEAEDDEEDYTTGDASLDNVRNQDEIGEKELLVASFGTSFNDNRRLTIGAIENAMEKAFPDYSVRRGFTAQIIIDHVERRDGIHIDNMDEALERAINNGVKTLVVQPTHLMNGLEYEELTGQLAEYADSFEQIAVGEPLLTSYDEGETAICFMGHGTEAASNEVYGKMQDLLKANGYDNYYVGTVEAEPSLEDVLTAVQAGDYKKVVLEPLMIVAGDHANNDMAGDEEGSWKTEFKNAGYEVTCILRGLGELPEIQQILVEHAQKAIDSLN